MSTGNTWNGAAPTNNEDWTRNDAPPPSAEDLVIGEGAAFDADAEAVEREAADREYKNIGVPGFYPLKVMNFGKLKKDLKDCYELVDGKPVYRRFEAYSVTVFFADARDTRYQISDVFTLPPDTAADLKRYNQSFSNAEMKTVGFHAQKTGQFLNRLIGGFAQGQPLPPAARSLKNWLGKVVDAEVVAQKARTVKDVDPATGVTREKTFDARLQVKLFSYRSPGTHSGAYAPLPAAQGGQNANHTPAPPPAAPARPQAPAPAGLNNI